MAPPLAIILAHEDPAKVRRLMASLDGLEILLHCDRRTPARAFTEMTRDAGRGVRALPRIATTLASWSLVDAELRALRVWLETSRAEHAIVMSGSCYPLVSTSELSDELEPWSGKTRMRLNPFPYERWGPDGGMRRVRRRFVTVRGQIVKLGGAPLCTFKRELLEDLRLCASSQWKIYCRSHAAALLRVLDEHPDLARFWRTTFVPDESCAASILSSPELVGALSNDVCDDLPWYIDWTHPRAAHPRSLGAADLEALTVARNAPPRPVDGPPGADGCPSDGFRKLFVRKVSSAEAGLLDAIDQRLRA